MLSKDQVREIRALLFRENPYPSGFWVLRHASTGGWSVLCRKPGGGLAFVLMVPEIPSHKDVLKAVVLVLESNSFRVSGENLRALIGVLGRLVEVMCKA